MILHETAHAWTDHALTSQRKAAFRDLRRWEFWRNYDDADWHENGTEIVDSGVQIRTMMRSWTPEFRDRGARPRPGR